MADDSELDYIAAFLGKVHTVATVGQIETYGHIGLIADTQKMFVLPGELLGSDGDDFYWKRYKVQISETSEANLTTAINNILIGIRKFNKRTAIAGFTRPATMCHMRFGNSIKSYYNAKTKRWDVDIMIDIEWSTS